MDMINIVKLIICLALCFAAAALGSWATMPNIPTWYAGLVKPPFNPPNWLFGPVWTLLYIMMAVSAWLVWEKGWQHQLVRGALYIFLLQLVLNSLWSIVFFGNHSLLGGMLIIVLLWLSIFWTIIRFWPISEMAAWLMIPYLLWVSFASVLNLAVALLNR
jgi:tryptophan-rich sensory protein